MSRRRVPLFENNNIEDETLVDTEEEVFEEESVEVQEEPSGTPEENPVLEESSIPENAICECGSTDFIEEDGKIICNECGRELTNLDESEEANPNKVAAIKKSLGLWKSGEYQKAVELYKKYGVSDREFVQVLLHTLRESEELEEDSRSMKCFHYEIISKKTGKVVIQNFGWYSDENSFWKNMNQEYPKSKFIVKMTKPMEKTNESQAAGVETDKDESLNKKIIRAVQEPINTSDRPNLDAAITEALKESVDVDTSKWSYATGKRMPSGYGLWWFKIGDKEVEFSGMYSDVKKKAISYANQRKIQRIILLP